MPVDLPPPFTAIVRNGLTLSLSNNRSYNMDGAFPRQLSVRGVNLLSGPIELWAKRTGGTLQQITATPTVTAEEDGLVTLGWSFTGVGISATGTIKVYAEGRMQFDVTITPTAATLWEQVYFIIPLATGIAQYLTKQPRFNATEPNYQALPWDYRDPGQTYYGWSASNTFPRSLWIHNESVGLVWGMDSDKNINSNIGDTSGSNPGSRRARIAIANDTPIGLAAANQLRFDMVRNVSLVSTANPLVYRFHLMATPPKALSGDEHLQLFGEEGSTPALTSYRPLTEEGGIFRWQGSGVIINPTAAAASRTARLARGLKDLIYMTYSVFPDVAPGFNAAWKCTVGSLNAGWVNNPAAGGYPQYPQFSTDNLGLQYYSLAATIIANTDYQTYVLGKVDDALAQSDGIYWDVTDYRFQEYETDAWGRGAYRISITETCDFVRRIAAKIHGAGKKMLSHAQGDFCPMRDCFFDWVLPGEQWRDEIAALSGNTKRRFYQDTLSEAQRRAELSPKALGTAIMFLPGWIESSYPTTSEWLQSEVMAGICLIHNCCLWHTTESLLAMQPLFSALKNFKAGKSLTHTPPWTNTLVTSSDPNVRISTWSEGNSLLAAIVNLSDSDRTSPITLSRPASSKALRYAATAQSPAEGRAAPGYTATISGSGRSFNVGVGRKVMTLVEFTFTPTSADITPRQLYGLINLIRKLSGAYGAPRKLTGR